MACKILLNRLKFSGRFGLKCRLSELLLFIFVTGVFVPPSVIRRWLFTDSCHRSLTPTIVAERPKAELSGATPRWDSSAQIHPSSSSPHALRDAPALQLCPSAPCLVLPVWRHRHWPRCWWRAEHLCRTAAQRNFPKTVSRVWLRANPGYKEKC